METRGGPSVAAALGSGEAGPGRAGRAVFGLTLRFALSAPPFGLRRASLRARPKTAKRKKNEQKRKKGGSAQEFVRASGFKRGSRKLVLGYTGWHERPRLHEDSVLARVSGLLVRDQRRGENSATVGAPQARQPEVGVFGLRRQVGRLSGLPGARSARPALGGVSHDGGGGGLPGTMSGIAACGWRRCPSYPARRPSVSGLRKRWGWPVKGLRRGRWLGNLAWPPVRYGPSTCAIWN